MANNAYFKPLKQFHALLGPPIDYLNMNGALQANKLAREEKLPFLGTCDRFQHALLEYERNALAEHSPRLAAGWVQFFSDLVRNQIAKNSIALF